MVYIENCKRRSEILGKKNWLIGNNRLNRVKMNQCNKVRK